jgi:uncharacterized protein (TIGR02145 family)
LTTSAITNITGTSALCGGTITSEGTSTVIDRGVCWSTGTSPTIADNKTKDGAGAGTFISNISGLNITTTYYVRAYATNSEGTGYGMAMSFTTTATEKDVDGNLYNIISIGTQLWLKENLKTTKYKDGTAIPLETTAWGNTTPEYCWYSNNQATYGNTYGALYNWYAVNTGKLCPAGWHVPSEAEWTTLITFLGGEDIVGGKLKEAGTTHWNSPNAGATNEFRFTALPGGDRNFDGQFDGVGNYAVWWSSTVYDNNKAWDPLIFTGSSLISRGTEDKRLGMSVRCIKD